MKAKDFVKEVNEIRETLNSKEIFLILEDAYCLTANEVELDDDELFIEFLESEHLINKRVTLAIATEDFENMDYELNEVGDYLGINISKKKVVN